MAGGGHVTTTDAPVSAPNPEPVESTPAASAITPDVIDEGPKPVEPTPAQTATADDVQLAQEGSTPTVDAATGAAQSDPPAHNETAPTGPTEGQATNDPHPPTTEKSDE
jgi:hypothetical protein